jgi:hypothetical protein
MWKAPGFLNPSETNSLEMVLIDAKVSSWFDKFSLVCVVYVLESSV